MIIHNSLEELSKTKRVVVLGNFDGIHLGHQNLILQGRKLADEKNARLTILTFYPQWQALHKPDFKYLLPQNEKIHFMENLKVDEVISVPCDEKFASTEPAAFIQDVLLDKLNVCGVVVGFNFLLVVRRKERQNFYMKF